MLPDAIVFASRIRMACAAVECRWVRERNSGLLRVARRRRWNEFRLISSGKMWKIWHVVPGWFAAMTGYAALVVPVEVTAGGV